VYCLRLQDFADDIAAVYHLIFPQRRGSSSAEKIENFYASQAGDYDRFREKLLPGRRELIHTLIPENFSGVWVDFGAGTGRNVEYALSRLSSSSKVILVDFCPSLLAIAKERVTRLGLHNVEIVEADVCTYDLVGIKADVVSFSYSLTMMPKWKEALTNAHRLLKEGGELGIVDFCDRQLDNPIYDNTFNAWFWRKWFAVDGVHLNICHQLYIKTHFAMREHRSWRHSLPVLPFLRPWRYLCVGRKLTMATQENLPLS
jgi:S-adenosylmethionine-diacylgycerolhomoserine-N-methlytransferase